MYPSSRLTIFRFSSKIQWQMFPLLYGRVCAHSKDTLTWRLHTKRNKFGWHTSANNTRDLIRGEVVYIAISSHIPDSWILFIEWLRFLVLIAWLVKTENGCCKAVFLCHRTLHQLNSSSKNGNKNSLTWNAKHGSSTASVFTRKSLPSLHCVMGSSGISKCWCPQWLAEMLPVGLLQVPVFITFLAQCQVLVS